MRFWAMAFSSVVLTCSWLTTSSKDCGRYLRAITWYMGWVSGVRTDKYARPRVIRGTRTAPLPLLPSGPGGVCGRPLHGARDLTRIHRNMEENVVCQDGPIVDLKLDVPVTEEAQVDAEHLAGIARGIADAEAGRTVTLDEARK